MGIVYRGFEPAIGRAVAVKIILPRQFSTTGEDEQMKLRFAREAAAAGTLSHENIVVIYRLEQENGVQYMGMEFVAGPSLEKMRSPGVPMSGAWGIPFSVFSLAFLHGWGGGIGHEGACATTI